MSTLIFNEKQIDELCQVDAKIIAKSFEANYELGVEAISNSTKGFSLLLADHKGDFIPSLDLDYRTYIIRLLSRIAEEIKEEHRHSALGAILFPD